MRDRGIMDQSVMDYLYATTASFSVRSEADFRFFQDYFAGGKWVFRGQAQAKWGLVSGLERLIDNERRFLKKEFKKYTHRDELCAILSFRNEIVAQYQWGDDYVQYLGLMQHFGARTRLLDFTHSLLVALGFAYEELYLKCERAIWAVRMNAICADERFMELRNAKPFLVEKEQRHIGWHLVPRKLGGVFAETDEQRKYFHEVANANISMSDDEEKQYGVQPVFLPGNCYRQEAQEALFLMPYTFDSFAVNLAYTFDTDEQAVNNPPSFSLRDLERSPERVNTFALIKLVFPSEFELTARKVLERAQITPRNLYPDIEGIAKSIRYH